MSTLAIIPARGGSKRIPRKNIKDFLGKPIIAYSIEAALASGVFDEVMVSTDDEEIKKIAQQCGASVPFLRSNENSNDFATTADVLLEVLNAYKQQRQNFDMACCIYPTAPFVSSSALIQGHHLLQQGFSSVFPVVRFGYPIWRALKMDEQSRVSLIWPDNISRRSQDLVAAFHDAGQWYWFDVVQFIKSGKLWTDNSYGIELSEMEIQDIDNEVDWKLAELKYRLANQP